MTELEELSDMEVNLHMDKVGKRTSLAQQVHRRNFVARVWATNNQTQGLPRNMKRADVKLRKF